MTMEQRVTEMGPAGIGWVTAVGLLVMGVLGGTGCGREPVAPSTPPDLPTVEVRVHEVVAGVYGATEEAVGTVRARVRATLEAKTTGRIARVMAVPGERVEEGQVLVELDLAEARAQLEQARAMEEQADRDLGRLRILLDQQAVTPSEFEAMEARTRVARSARAEAETRVGYAEVTAPFTGQVTRKFVEVGDLASPGRALMELEDPSRLRLEADVSALRMDQIRLGDRLPVRVGEMRETLQGVVSEMEPSADAASRTFRVRLDLPEGAGVRAGMFGRVTLPAGESERLTVPGMAVERRGQMELVWVVVEGRAALRLVRTGRSWGEDTEVLSGLKAGERVVVGAPLGMREGQPVVEMR